MQTARRLYVYVMSGATLVVLLVGLTTLVRIGFEQLGVQSMGFGGRVYLREQLALAGALIAVGLPTWGVHWWLAQRSVRAERPHAEQERRSAVRALYFALVLGGLAIWVTFNVQTLVASFIYTLAGERIRYIDVGGAASAFLVGGLAFGYHAILRIAERDVVTFAGASAWLLRLYRYGVAMFAGLIALFGVLALIQLAGDLVARSTSVIGVGDWFIAGLAGGMSAVVAGGAVWLGHFAYSTRLRNEKASGEDRSRVRLTYWLAMLGVGVALTIAFWGDGLGVAIAAVLGISPSPTMTSLSPGAPLWLQLAGPVVSALPFALAGWLAYRISAEEAVESNDPARIGTVRRLSAALPGLIGLTFAAVAVTRLIKVGLEMAFGASIAIGSDAWANQVATFLPLLLLGALAWAAAWLRLQDDRAHDPPAEARSTVRRTYLLLILAAALLSAISSLGLILYRLFNILLGDIPSGGVVGELSTPIGIAAVALVLAAYHAVQLRGDLRITGGRLIGGGEPGTARPAVVTLVLTGPNQDDLAATLDDLRLRLPPGYRLEPRGGGAG